MDIYFENLIWDQGGTLDTLSPVRWVDPYSGKNNFGDFRVFLKEWYEFTPKEKKSSKFFLAAKELMSVRNTNETDIEKNSPIEVWSFFPKFYKFISNKDAAFYFDCSGKNLINFNKLLVNLNVTEPNLFSVGWSVPWEQESLTIYPAKSLITLRYGPSDFVSFSIDLEDKSFDLNHQLNLLIDSLGKFKIIKIIRNKEYEKLIGNALPQHKKIFEDLVINKFSPQIIIEDSSINFWEKSSKLARLFINKIECLLSFSIITPLVVPVFVAIASFFGSWFYEVSINSSSKKIYHANLGNSIRDHGSLVFLDKFINQSKSLNKIHIESIILNVQRKSKNMTGSLRIKLKDKLLGSANSENSSFLTWEDGISKLGKNGNFDDKSNTLTFDVTYPVSEKNKINNQKAIANTFESLLAINTTSKKKLEEVLISMGKKNKVKVSFVRQPIGNINNFLINFQKKQSGWDWVSMNFVSVGQGLTSFYGAVEPNE